MGWVLYRQRSNSRRDSVVHFRGATLAMTRGDTIELSQSSARKYTQAPYISGGASENAWSCMCRMVYQWPRVYLLGILHDFNASNPSIQHGKRIWYWGVTSSSKSSPRVHNYWNHNLACNTNGAANSNESKDFEKKNTTTALYVIHKSGAYTKPLKVKQSSDIGHGKTRTLKRSKYLYLKSRRSILAISLLLDPHFTKGILACEW